VKDKDKYLADMRNDSTWADEIQLATFLDVFPGIQSFALHEVTRNTAQMTAKIYTRPGASEDEPNFHLFFSGNHFNVLVPL